MTRVIALLLALVALAASPASGQDVIKLKFSHFLPAAHNHHANVIVPWVEEVRKKTNGRVEITVFPTASLCKPPQQYECTRDGISDISWAVTGWTPNRFPMSSVLELPFMHRTAATGAQMLADLWDPYLHKEFDDVHVLGMNVHAAGHVHTTNKPIRTLEDFKGMKIRTPTAVVGDLLDTLGATKIGMPVNAIYESASNGVIDGFALPYEALPSFKLHEVAKYTTEVGMYTTVFMTIVNKKKWDSLPADVKRVLEETTSPRSGQWKRVGESWDKAEVVGRKAVVDRRNEILVLPREERRRWRDAVKGVDEKWAADLEKRGLPGRALLKDARALAVKYGEGD
jgi:TRAP-type C4-dicarboxylate transport system substrate-binding protein